MSFRLVTRTALVALALLSLTAAVPAGEGWGTIKGQIVWPGDVPEREKIDVNKDQDACLAKGPLFSEKYVVDPKTKGVKNVFIWLLDPSGDFYKKLPIHPALKAPKASIVEIDQPCCQFIPHVVAIRDGQGLVFKNSAEIPHNVHVYGGIKGPEFNVILPAGGKKEVTADLLPARHTPIPVKCDIHGWMNGFVRVFPHPYFALTGDDGSFTIENAPAGDYRIAIWHEESWVKGDKKGIPITIKAGEVTDLGKVPMPPPKKAD